MGNTHIYCSRQLWDEHPGFLCCFQSSLFKFQISEQFEVVFTCSMYFSEKYLLFVTRTAESAITQSLSELMEWKSRRCCLQVRGAALFCWVPSPGRSFPWPCRSGWILQVLPQGLCSHLWPGCAWGRGMPWIHKCGAPCPNQGSGTAWKAEELCTSLQSVINCRVKGV